MVLFDLCLVLAAGLVGAIFARGCKLPVFVGYLLGGVVVGGLTAGRLVGDPVIFDAANFGVAMLMFSLGVELSFGVLSSVGWRIVAVAVIQVLVTMGIVTFGSAFLGVSFGTAVFIGAALSLSSTAVVVKFLEESGKMGSQVGQLSITWMLIQDLLVVPFFFFLPVISGTQPLGMALFMPLLKTALVVAAVVIFGRKFGKIFLAALSRADAVELFLLGLVVWVLTSAVVSFWLGLTMTLGVFLAGVMLGGSNRETAIVSLTRPMRDLFAAIFFTSLGLFLSPSFAIAFIGPLLVVTIIILLAKFFISFMTLRLFGYHSRLSLDTAAPMAGVGEFAFVIMGLGRSLGVVSQNVFSFSVGLTLLSIAATPLFTRFSEKWLARMITKKQEQGSESDFIQIETDKDGHIILCGFGRVGSWVGQALSREGIPFVVIDYHHQALALAEKLGAATVYGDSSDLRSLEKAGVRSAKMVIITLPDRLSQEVVIGLVKKANAQATIVGRAHREVDRRDLTKLGAQTVIEPEFEASLSIIHRVLQSMGKSKEEVSSVVKSLKADFG